MRQRPLKHILTLLLVLYPILVNLLLMVSLTGYSLLDLAPFWNDEIFHWHQPLTFSVAGFNGGYYTVSEIPPPLDNFHFYAWGPFTPVFYGIFATVLPWSLNVLALVNIGLFLLATLAFIVLAKLDIWQQMILAFTLGTFIPLMLFLHSSLLQIFHLSLALVIAGCFVRLLRETVSWRFVLSAGLLILFAGLQRPGWILLLLPLLLLSLRRLTPVMMIGTLISSALVTILSFVIFQQTRAPYPNELTEVLEIAITSPSDVITALLDVTERSQTWLLSGFPHVLGMRLQIVGLILVAGVALLHIIWRRYRSPHSLTSTQRVLLREMAFHLYNPGTLFLLNIVTLNVRGGNDYRTMAPHMLLSLLILLAQRRYRLLGAFVGFTLLLMPVALAIFLTQSGASTINGDRVRAEYDHYAPQFTQIMSYDPTADSAWCNTVTVTSLYIMDNPEPGMLLAIPPGMGISWVYDETVPDRFKAQYLILNDDAVDQWQSRLNIAPLMEVYEGALYRNLDADCPT